MANNKKFNVVSIVLLAVLAVALIMGIVGLCIDWLSVTTEIASVKETEAMKLAEMVKDNKDAGGDLYKAIGAVQAFAIISVIAAALTLISYLVSKFVDLKVLKFVTIACAAVLILCALLALILTFVTGNSEIFDYAKKAAEAMKGKFTVMPAAGCWLLSIFGIVGGAAGVYGGLEG